MRELYLGLLCISFEMQDCGNVGLELVISGNPTENENVGKLLMELLDTTLELEEEDGLKGICHVVGPMLEIL